MKTIIVISLVLLVSVGTRAVSTTAGPVGTLNPQGGATNPPGGSGAGNPQGGATNPPGGSGAANSQGGATNPPNNSSVRSIMPWTTILSVGILMLAAQKIST